jgi:hypothetical protein
MFSDSVYALYRLSIFPEPPLGLREGNGHSSEITDTEVAFLCDEAYDIFFPH